MVLQYTGNLNTIKIKQMHAKDNNYSNSIKTKIKKTRKQNI